jgi:nucleoside-diphosphate-sugar epimerase
MLWASTTPLLISAVVAAAAEPRRALVLGGTQFMGRLTVERLLAEPAYDEVAMLNRGHSVLPASLAAAVAEGRLTHLLCDRMDERGKFKRLLRDRGPWALVVDFIGFERRFTEDAVAALAVGDGGYGALHYVHISTDSVYQATPLPADGGGPLDEACCARAADAAAHARVAGRTDEGRYQLGYGGNKLSCDEALAEAWAASKFPYTSLRLPDVYGPWDNQGGLWTEFLEPVLAGTAVAGYLPPERMRARGPGHAPDFRAWELSWLYAPDLVDAVLAVAAAGRAVHGHVLHVAHEERVTIEATARLVAAAAGVADVAVDFAALSDTPQHDPGPISVAKALAMLDWRPTPIDEAVRRAVAWYRASDDHRAHADRVRARDDEDVAPTWVPLCARACSSCGDFRTSACGAACAADAAADLRAHCAAQDDDDDEPRPEL